MDFIIDRLAIGELLDGENHPPVDAILNLSEFDYPTPLAYKRMFFPDFEYLKDLSLIGECTAYLRGHIRQRRRVLVHCFAGISRSAMICTAYLYECGMSFEEAIAFVRRKHPIANPHEALMRSLRDWYEISQ